MNTKESVNRIRINISPLTNRFLVGIGDAKDRGFLEKKDMTQDLLAVLMDYLEEGKAEWPFSDSKGKKYSLRIINKDKASKIYQVSGEIFTTEYFSSKKSALKYLFAEVEKTYAMYREIGCSVEIKRTGSRWKYRYFANIDKRNVRNPITSGHTAAEIKTISLKK